MAADSTTADCGAEDEGDSPTVLDPWAEAADLEPGSEYLSVVNGVEDYGVFVSLTPPDGSDLSGLVHHSELPALTKPTDYQCGERFVVEYERSNGPDEHSFKGLWANDKGTFDGTVPEVDPAANSRLSDAAVNTDADGQRSGDQPTARRLKGMTAGADGSTATPPGGSLAESDGGSGRGTATTADTPPVGPTADVLARLDEVEERLNRRLDAGFGVMDDVLGEPGAGGGSVADLTDLASAVQQRTAAFRDRGYSVDCIGQEQHDDGTVTMTVTFAPETTDVGGSE